MNTSKEPGRPAAPMVETVDSDSELEDDNFVAPKRSSALQQQILPDIVSSDNEDDHVSISASSFLSAMTGDHSTGSQRHFAAVQGLCLFPAISELGEENIFHLPLSLIQEEEQQSSNHRDLKQSYNQEYLFPDLNDEIAQEGVQEKENQTESPSRRIPSPTESDLIAPPPKQEKSPMGALYTWCSQHHRVALNEQDYIAWDDGTQDHIKKYTCVLVFPVSGECFFSGRYTTSDTKQTFLVESTELSPYSDTVWYPTKKLAKHAAAARAYDCLTYRHGLEIGKRYQQMGLDEPLEDQMPFPCRPPVFEKIEQAYLKAIKHKCRVYNHGLEIGKASNGIGWTG